MSATCCTPIQLWQIRITPRRPELDARGGALLRDVHELGLTGIQRVCTSQIFLLEGPLAESDVERAARELLTDPVTERYTIYRRNGAAALPDHGCDAAIEVRLKGGVMDPVAASTQMALADMGIDTSHLTVATGRLYQLQGCAHIDEADLLARRLLFNDCIEEVYLSGFGRHDPRPDHLPVAPERPFEIRRVPLRELSADELARLSRDAHLFLSLEEMEALQAHYRGQGRDPIDVELETFAQTWSEHCVHKTLKSAVRYRGAVMPPSSGAAASPGADGGVEISYENLLRDTIARATRELTESGRVNWCLSVFEDNAGVIAFDKEYGVAFKVETHNHPSAIEPYGGAATGIGGVIRDVLGCGLGAKPIANTDVFCVARPDLPMELLPKGVLHPRRVLKGVVAGVRDYGNRMGIPTVNGAVLFDDRYLGNPLVFCGCVGLIPRNRIRKEPRPGDLVVVIGGRTGRDGIHGATFSSAELTDSHADEFSHAVQIGNAITEKKVLDVLLKAREHEGRCLYTAVTDCGAGGLSSAVGEMGSKLGATVDLEKVPLKYAGLRYDEIWISEAQERMVFSLPPENREAFERICQAENVEATVIGTFRDDGRLLIRYDGQVVGDIDADFLHNGIPSTRREASWQPAGRGSVAAAAPAPTREALLERLADLEHASKEWIIRQYDHEVQGASVIKPLTGPGQGPSDAAVLRPRLDRPAAIALGCGICPELSEVDPYWMAVAAIDEAIRNVVCVGGNPDCTAILDNFCWGNCQDERTMGALVRACQACYDAAVAHGTPFISGKDSLNNEFALAPDDALRLAERIPISNNRVRIPETLLISAISRIDDAARCVTMDAKRGGGPSRCLYVGLSARAWPEVRLEEAAALHRAVAALIHAGKVMAAHDCGSGGVLVALAEMAIAGQCGIEASFGEPAPMSVVPGGYVLQVSTDDAGAVRTAVASRSGIMFADLGQPREDRRFVYAAPDGSGGFDVPVDTLATAWRSSLNW
jgi:phosphoribosylformylglycinamidine synthase